MAMNYGRYLALQEVWWVKYRHVEPIATALKKSSLRWATPVRQRLRENKKNSLKPCTQWELAGMLCRDPGNLYRLLNGEITLTVADVSTMASILNLPVQEFIPQPVDLVAAATLRLCNGKVSRHDARAYAVYRTSADLRNGPCLDEKGIASVLISMSGVFCEDHDVEVAVTRVAAALERCLGDLAERKEGGDDECIQRR
jgi:hypothetical protein